MLANLDAEKLRLDRLEYVLMRRPAGQVDHDDRLVAVADAPEKHLQEVRPS